jgi:hypothetical protein
VSLALLPLNRLMFQVEFDHGGSEREVCLGATHAVFTIKDQLTLA